MFSYTLVAPRKKKRQHSVTVKQSIIILLLHYPGHYGGREAGWKREDAMAKTKNPGNYGQGPLTPTLPPFNPRRDLSLDSWFSTSISRSNVSILKYFPTGRKDIPFLTFSLITEFIYLLNVITLRLFLFLSCWSLIHYRWSKIYFTYFEIFHRSQSFVLYLKISRSMSGDLLLYVNVNALNRTTLFSEFDIDIGMWTVLPLNLNVLNSPRPSFIIIPVMENHTSGGNILLSRCEYPDMNFAIQRFYWIKIENRKGY